MPQGSTDYRRTEKNAGPDLKGKATDQFEKIADKATNQFNKAADTVEDVATRVAEQGRAAGQQVHGVAGNVKDAVDNPSRTSRWRRLR